MDNKVREYLYMYVYVYNNVYDATASIHGDAEPQMRICNIRCNKAMLKLTNIFIMNTT